MKYLRILTFSLCFLMVACSPHHTKHQGIGDALLSRGAEDSSTKLLRSDPGYIQWLIQQSFLYKAREANLLVSGTSLAWRQSGSRVNHWPLLEKASTWLYLSPKNILPHRSHSSALAMLSQASMVATLQQKGLSLYLSDILESNSVWTSKVSLQGDTSLSSENSSPPISYDIAQSVGNKQDLMALHSLLRQTGSKPQNTLRPQLLGTDILPASTALGPDFFLAARGHKDYIGTYAMIEIAPHDWSLLPDMHEDWQCQALTQNQHEALAQKGIIPRRMTRDNRSFSHLQNTPSTFKSGWAATGPVRGVDGNLRRWVYAYANNPMQAILHWNDPSANAKRILSASIINNTGILGLPLVGLCLKDLYGFEPESAEPTTTASPDNSNQSVPKNSIFQTEPMLTVAKSLAHEIRSYGGWSWLREALPTPQLRKFMQSSEHRSSGPDFFTSKLGKTMQEALAQRQAGLLHNYFDEILQCTIDSTRFAHILPNLEQGNQQNPDLPQSSSIADIRFATTFFASQSGLVFFPTESLMSLALSLSHKYSAEQQMYAQGYDTLSIPTLQKNIMTLPDFAPWREQHNIATAQLIARLPSSASALTLLSSLENNYLLTVSNFSEGAIQEEIPLPDYVGPKTSQIQELAHVPSVPEQDNLLFKETDVWTITLKIPAKSCRIFIITP